MCKDGQTWGQCCRALEAGLRDRIRTTKILPKRAGQSMQGISPHINQYGVISENRLTTVPKGTDMEIAALLADTLTTGFGLVNNDAYLKIGESIVVIGCGGIGLGVVLGAHLAGGHPCDCS